MLVSKTLPNLINGVSQQPDALRMDTQCTAQENAYPSVVEGLTKRLPTEHVAQTNLAADAKTFVHTINREAPEQYTVILRDKLIRVYDKDGALKTVEMGTGTGTNNADVTYLDTGNADTSLKALTIADVTYIVNTEKTTAMTGTTTTSVSPHEALIFINQAFASSSYTVDIEQPGASGTISSTETAGEPGDAVTIATNIANDLNTLSSPSALQHTSPTTSVSNFQTGGGGTVNVQNKYVGQSFTATSTDPLVSFTWKSDVDLSDKTLYWSLHSADPSTGAPTSNFDAGGQLTTGTWQTGPVANATQQVNFGTVYPTGNPFVPTVGTRYWIRCSYANVGPKPVPRGWLHDTAGYATGESYYNGAVQSGDFWFKVNVAGATSGAINAEASGPVIYVSSNEPFDIKGTNSYTDNYIDVFKGSAQKLSDLPVQAKDGMIMKIAGSVDAGEDDYYLKFVSNAQGITGGGNIGPGVWEECAGPGIEDGLEPDASTMPHLLIKQANGTFVFKRADGENHTSGSDTYDYSTFKWGSRLAGDKLTNPDPTFIGRTINNLFLFKNRFGILSDENIVMSEAGEFFNFFRATAIDLLDTAPIDIASASSEVSILRHAVPLAEKLVILSDAGQFILQSDTALSSKTVAMARSTAYNILKDAEPSASENAVFFAFNRGSFSGVREYIPSDVEDNFEAIDISAQIPKYIPGKITKIVAANHENVVFCMTEGDPDALYVYNYYNGDRQRIQSAWHRWEFGTGAKILNIDLIDTDLYLTVYRTGGVFIEKMAIEVGKTDSGSNYVARLDRRVSNTSTGVSVNGKLVTLPYSVTSGRTIEVMTAAGKRLPAVPDGGSQVTFDVGEDMTGVSFFAGEPYTMSYTFSDLVLREQTKTGGLAVMTDGRIQVRYGTITFGESGSFNVAVTPDFRDTSTHTFTGRILGAGSMKLGEVPLESGELRFPVFSKADQVNITVTNDAPLPCNLLSAEYEISWNPRSRRM